MRFNKEKFEKLRKASEEGDLAKKQKNQDPLTLLIVLGLPLLIISAVWFFSGTAEISPKGERILMHASSDPFYFWLYWGLLFGAGSLLVLGGIFLSSGKTRDREKNPEKAKVHFYFLYGKKIVGSILGLWGWLLFVSASYGIVYFFRLITKAK